MRIVHLASSYRVAMKRRPRRTVELSAKVSALCFQRPQAIDMRRAGWIFSPKGVTCSKCLRLIEKQAKAS